MSLNSKFFIIMSILAVIWVLPWKIYSVWLASKNDHRRWFLVLLLLNTFSILEIFYVFYILKKRWADVKQDCKEGWMLFKQEFKIKKEVKIPT